MVVRAPAEHARAIDPVGRRVVVVPLDVVRRLVEQVGLGELGVKVGDRLVRVDVGLERRRDLALGEEVPVDRLEEGVLLELGGVALRTEAVLRVAVEELRLRGEESVWAGREEGPSRGARERGRTPLTNCLPSSPMTPRGNLTLPKQLRERERERKSVSSGRG